MTETTQISITKEQFDSLLLNYYKKYFQDENIFIRETILPDSYDDENVVFTVKREEKIGNYKAEKKYNLNHEDIKTAINADLEKHGYKVDYFNYRIINKQILGIDAFINKLEKAKQKTL